MNKLIIYTTSGRGGKKYVFNIIQFMKMINRESTDSLQESIIIEIKASHLYRKNNQSQEPIDSDTSWIAKEWDRSRSDWQRWINDQHLDWTMNLLNTQNCGARIYNEDTLQIIINKSNMPSASSSIYIMEKNVDENDAYYDGDNVYSVVFENEPFGIVFAPNKANKQNLFVKSIDKGGVADQLGVEVGSIVIRFDSESVEDKGAKKIFQIFHNKYANQLPLKMTFKRMEVEQEYNEYEEDNEQNDDYEYYYEDDEWEYYYAD